MITILKQPKQLCFSQKETFLKFRTSYQNTDKTNLKGMIQVEKAIDSTPLDVQQARYHPLQRDTAVDVKTAFNDLQPPLPPDVALGQVSAPFYFLSKSSDFLKCRIWDRYDEQPLEDAPQISNSFNVIYGDSTVDYVFNVNYATTQHICHRYPNGYRKTVTQQQPDFLNLIVPSPFSDCSVEVNVLMSTGQYITLVLHQNFTIPDNVLVSFPCGFFQLNIFNRIKSQFPSPNVYPVSYIFSIFDNKKIAVLFGQPEMPRYMIAQKSFILDNRVPDETIYIAYENGLGGIETQYFPVYQKRRESEIELSDLMLFDEANPREGDKIESKNTHFDKYTVKTRILPRADLEIMQRISHAPIWLIHPESHFERIYADTKNLDAPPSHLRFGHFTFSYKKYS